MKQNKLPKQIPRITSTTIDSAMFPARINEKIAKAHEQNEKSHMYRNYKKGADIPTFRYSYS